MRHHYQVLKSIIFLLLYTIFHFYYINIVCNLGTHHSDESINIAIFLLSKPVDPENALDVVGRIPGRIEQDDAVSGRHVKSQRARASRDQE